MFSQLCIFVLKLLLIIEIKIVLAMLLDSLLTSISVCVLKWFKKKAAKHLTPMYKESLVTNSI